MAEVSEGAVARLRTGKPVPLPTGGRLSMEGAGRITAEQRARVVVLAGPQRSGKTTLLAEIYSQYQHGPFAGYAFAGSASLMAFEQCCHESRAQSGLELPTTTRTSRAETGMLHLALLPDAGGGIVQILLSDVSGEFYEAVLNLPQQAAAIPALSRADAVSLVIDGEGLAELRERNKVKYDVELLLDALLEHGNLRPDTTIDPVIAKWDCVAAAGQDAVKFAKSLAQDVVARVSTSRPSSSVLTCARSLRDASVKSGYGLDDLLHRWTESSTAGDLLPAYAVPAVTPIRAMDRSKSFES